MLAFMFVLVTCKCMNGITKKHQPLLKDDSGQKQNDPNTNKDILYEETPAPSSEEQKTFDTELMTLLRDQPMSEKKKLVQMILEPEIEKKRRIIEELIVDSGNQFFIKNIRCINKFVKYGSNQLVKLMLSVVEDDREIIKILANMIGNMEEKISQELSSSEDDLYRAMSFFSRVHREMEAAKAVEIEMFERLRARFAHPAFKSYLGPIGTFGLGIGQTGFGASLQLDQLGMRASPDLQGPGVAAYGGAVKGLDYIRRPGSVKLQNSRQLLSLSPYPYPMMYRYHNLKV